MIHCQVLETTGLMCYNDEKLLNSKLCFTVVDVTSGINILSGEGTDDTEVMDG